MPDKPTTAYRYDPKQVKCAPDPKGYPTRIEAVEAWLLLNPASLVSPRDFIHHVQRYRATKHLNRLRNEARRGDERKAKERRALRASTAPEREPNA